MKACKSSPKSLETVRGVGAFISLTESPRRPAGSIRTAVLCGQTWHPAIECNWTTPHAYVLVARVSDNTRSGKYAIGRLAKETNSDLEGEEDAPPLPCTQSAHPSLVHSIAARGGSLSECDLNTLRILLCLWLRLNHSCTVE